QRSPYNRAGLMARPTRAAALAPWREPVFRLPQPLPGRVSRTRLAAVTAGAVIVLATTGVVIGVTAPVTYTGCLNQVAGVLHNLQAASTPLQACLTADAVASWDNAGPAGPAGAK